MLFLYLRRGPFLRPGLRAAQGSRWTGRHRIGFDAREGAPLVEYRPRDAGELVGECNGEHVVVQSLFAASIQDLSP
jgi:hypothetical protein